MPDFLDPKPDDPDDACPCCRQKLIECFNVHDAGGGRTFFFTRILGKAASGFCTAGNAPVNHIEIH